MIKIIILGVVILLALIASYIIAQDLDEIIKNLKKK